MPTTYLIALGSNRRHHAFGRPRDVVLAAIGELSKIGRVTAQSCVISTDPIGPAQRRFANAAALLESDDGSMDLLEKLKGIERRFGRRRGQVWGDRVLDLDIVLWSGGIVETRSLSIPHREFRTRGFVLVPASEIAPYWRDPKSGRTLRQLTARCSVAR